MSHMGKCSCLMWIVVVVATVVCVPSLSMCEQTTTVEGLWVLAGVMPAGVPMEEVPKGLTERHFYWFQEDGTLMMTVESPQGRSKHKALWKQDGNRLVIVWANGVKNLIRVVRIGGNSMILTGLDVRPLWYRFVRYF